MSIDNPQLKQIQRRLAESEKEVEIHNSQQGNARKYPKHFRAVSVVYNGAEEILFCDRKHGAEAFEKELDEIFKLYPDAESIKIELFIGPKAATAEETATVVLKKGGPKPASTTETVNGPAVLPQLPQNPEPAAVSPTALQIFELQKQMQITEIRAEHRDEVRE